MRLTLTVLFLFSLSLQVLCEVYEAENGVLLGGATSATDSSTFTGTGYVTNFKTSGDAVQFNLQGTAALYNLTLRYRSPFGSKKSNIYLNTNSLGEFTMAQTSDWTTIFLTPLSLAQGANTLVVDAGWGYWDLDNIDVSLSFPSTPVSSTTVYQAESGALFGSATVATDSSSYTGVGFVGNMKGSSDGVTFTVQGTAASYSISLRYRTPFGMKKTRLFLNGQDLGEFALDSSDWTKQTLTQVTLLDGANTLVVNANWGYWDLDSVEITLFVPETTAQPTTPPVVVAPVTVYEAESGALFGGAAITTDSSSYTGTGFVGNMKGSSDGVRFTVQGTATLYNIALRYRTPFGMKKTRLFLNGQDLGEFALDSSDWTKQTLTQVTLLNGANTLVVNANWGYWDLDSVEVSLYVPPTTAPVYVPTTIYEAESGTLVGGATVATDSTNFSGTGYVANFKGTSDAVQFAIQGTASTYNFVLRYRSPFGMKKTRLFLNGKDLGEFAIDASEWTRITLTQATLLDGANTLVVNADWGYWELDYLEVASTYVPTPAPTTSVPTLPPTEAPTPPPTAGPVYEAENGVLLRGAKVMNDSSNYSGTGYVGDFQNSADGVRFAVLGTPALYSLTIRYRAVYGFKKARIEFNGNPFGEVDLNGANDWTELVAAKLLMVNGTNVITIYANWAYWELDNIEIHPAQPVVQPPASGLPIDPLATNQAKHLLSFLQSQYGSKTLSGQQELSEAQWVQQNVGKFPALVGFDFMDYSPSRVERGATSQAVEQSFQWTGMGGITTFCWHWNAPTGLIDTVGKEWWRGFYTDATTFDLQAALNEGPTGQNYTLLIRDIDAIAVQLKRLQAANIPVLFRPLHEAEGGWFWWGAKGPEPCKQLYRILFDRITNYHQIHNLLWVWNSVNPDWYPGADVCDIVSFDSYPNGPDHSAQDTKFYQLVELGGRTKVVAMAENGPVPSPDMMHIYGSVWSYFVTWNGFQRDTSINTLSFLQSVYNDSRVITLGDLSTIYNTTTAAPTTAAPTTAPTTAAPTTAAPTTAAPTTPAPICGKNQDVCNGQCYDDKLYDCLKDNGKSYLCPEDNKVCNGQCYDDKRYDCIKDNGKTFLCPEDNDVCNGQCYDTKNYDCIKDKGKYYLCGKGAELCNGACYDPKRYECVKDNGQQFLCPEKNDVCNGQCYDTNRYDCLKENENYYLCRDGEKVCNGSCYDNKHQKCSNGRISPKKRNVDEIF
jgi:mannan endo-1,4-beta-mannosidase